MNSLISAAMRRGKTMKKTKLRAAPALVGVIASVVVLGRGRPGRPAQHVHYNRQARVLRADAEPHRRGDCLVVAADFVISTSAAG